MTGEKARFTSDRRVPSSSSWTDDGDWAAGVAEHVEVVGGELVGRAPEQTSRYPDSVTDNAYGWYDAENLSLANGDSVTTRLDISGQNNDIDGSGTSQSSQVNGEDSVYYNGSEYHSTSVTIGVPKTWFLVFRWDGTTGISAYDFQVAIGDGGSKNNRNGFGLLESGSWLIRLGDRDYSGGSTDTNWHVGTFQTDGSNGFGRIDGVQFASGPSGRYDDSQTITVGARDNGNPIYFPGSIPEAIFVNADVSLSDIETTEQALADEYGITL